MQIHRCWISLLLLVPCVATAQSKYTDPDSPVTDAAARQALGHAQIIAIAGVTSGIQGVLQDLGAKVVGQEVRIDLAADVLFNFDNTRSFPKPATLCEKLAK